MDWDVTKKNTWPRRSCPILRAINASCIGVKTVLELQLDQELNEHEDDERFNYFQWDTTDWAVLATFTATYEEYKETLIGVIDDLARHFYIAKLKITSSWDRTKSKAITVVKNTASHIPWLYTTCEEMVASNIIYCVFVLMATTNTQAFCINFKQCLFIILKLVTHI